MTHRISLALTLAAMLLISSQPLTTKAAPPEYDLIIRNGRVIDGTGRLGFNADVAIKGDRIARVGNLRAASAKRIIDARGQVVAPGFIDMLGQSESFVLIDPRAMSKVMKDGALGVSTSLQYVPARFAKTHEIVELAKVAHQYGGIYITHQRSEANAIDDSMKEVFEIARRANIPAEIWHFKTAYKKNWGRMPEMLQRIATARRQGLKITADVYPYVAGSTSLSACLPPWALEGGTERMISRLKDSATRDRLKQEITTDSKTWENIYLGSGGPRGILISAVVDRELESWQGKRLSEIASAQNKDPLDSLFDFIIADHGQTGAIFFMMQESDMNAALKSPFVSICTDSGARATDGPLAGSKSHPRGWGSYPRILGRYVRDQKLMPLELAIRKMTGLPASNVGLKQRGLLREGYFADVTIFDPNTVIDRATFEQPNQYPVGINYVIVNGQIEVDNGKRTPAEAGRVLRGPGYESHR